MSFLRKAASGVAGAASGVASRFRPDEKVAPCDAPAKVSLVRRTDTSLELQWDAPQAPVALLATADGGVFEYEVRYVVSDESSRLDQYRSSGTVTVKEANVVIEALWPGHTYQVKVKARFWPEPDMDTKPTWSDEASISPESQPFTLMTEDQWELVEHNLRVDQFLAGTMQPFEMVYEQDSKGQAAARVGSMVVDAMDKSGIAGLLGVSAVTSGVRFARDVGKYGAAAVLFRGELASAVKVLSELTSLAFKDVQLDMKTDLTFGIYYLLWMRHRDRLWRPDTERLLHRQGGVGVVEEVAPQDLLDELTWFAPLAKYAYRKKRHELQWVCRLYPTRNDADAGFQLVASSPKQRTIENESGEQVAKPAWHLMVNRERKTAVFAIRGTASIEDAIADAMAVFAPIEYRGQEYVCHGAMEKAARWLAEEGGAARWATKFAKQGYRLVATGHSLGAGVATLLGVVLHRLTGLKIDVFGYAAPACVDQFLATELEAASGGPVCVKTLINRDDVVPRASAVNGRMLATELDMRRAEWEPLMEKDVDAIKGRMKTLWAPRKRRLSHEDESDGAQILSADSTTKQVEADGLRCRTTSLLATKSCLRVLVKRASGLRDASTALQKRMDPYVCVQFGARTKSTGKAAKQHQTPCWDEDDASLEFWFSSKSEDLPDSLEIHVKHADPLTNFEIGRGSLAVDTKLLSSEKPTEFEVNLTHKNCGDGESAGTVVLSVWCEANDDVHEQRRMKASDADDGKTLIPMAVPGTIVHLFRQNGGTRASVISNDWPGLLRIEVQQTLLDDHKMGNILDALRDCRAARHPACQQPPQWQPQSASGGPVHCSVCRHSTDWSAVAGSEAEQVRVTHHCYACGQFVCEDCSKTKQPLPAIGIFRPVRTCDACAARLSNHILGFGGEFADLSGWTPTE